VVRRGEAPIERDRLDRGIRFVALGQAQQITDLAG